MALPLPKLSDTSEFGVHLIQYMLTAPRLKLAEIIPTVIDDFHSSFLINATWGKHASAALGNTLHPEKLQHQPTITFLEPGDDEGDDDDQYEALKHKKHDKHGKHEDKHPAPKPMIPLNNLVIAMTDPDAPSRDDPKWSEIAHWLAIGVPMHLNSTTDPLVLRLSNSNDEEPTHGLVDILPYKPPGPPPKTGKHRYVFVAFSPLNGTSEPLNLTVPKERRHWGFEGERMGVRQWASENGLVQIGANFVYAQNDKQ